ncbi:MAG TPA: PEGA domain-containing protein [Candidatus Saccharimonadales bacterium]
MIGYVLVGIALLLMTIILLYQAYGFGYRNGEVIQNGLVYVSSVPNPASIYINGQKRSETTNTRLLLEAGQYTFQLNRDGYHTWKRAITVDGGAVVHFDYPFLFPAKLTTTNVKKYTARPALFAQSPDRRWAMVQSDAYNTFDVYDLNSQPLKAPTAFTIAPTAFTTTAGANSLQLVKWADDNKHVVLQHIANDKGAITTEYILIDRTDPTATVNLTKTLGINPTKLELRNDKYDGYFLYNQTDQTLQRVALNSSTTPQLLLDHVLAYKTYGDNVILYATTAGAGPGKVAIKLQDGNQTFTLREVTPSATYLLDLTKYSGDWFVGVGSSVESRTYVYKNPAQTMRDKPKNPLVPVQVLKTKEPNYISFSENARFIVVENGTQFGIYDAENDKGYAYTLPDAMDAPQTHATWMDGHRLMYTSSGKLVVFEFDNANHEVLSTNDPNYMPFFDPNYKWLYTFADQPATATTPAQFNLLNTALRTPQDQ